VENATYFQKLGLVTVLPQQALTNNSLTLAVNSTYQGRNVIKKNLELSPIKDKSRQISRIIADYKR
jgi:predicted glycosyltransferase